MQLTELTGDTGGWEFDLVTEMFRLTEGTRRLLGCAADEPLTLEQLLDMCHPNDRDEVRAALDRVVETEKQVKGS